MLRIRSTLIAGALALAAAVPAYANWYKSTCHGCNGWYHGWHAAYHANHYWPEPYVLPDRMAVKSPICYMEARGWQRYNLLGPHHFEEDQSRLNPAGMLRVKSIMANSPPQFKAIYVERANDPSVTSARIDAIQQGIVSLNLEGPLPSVQASEMVVEGWSSEYVDAVGRKFNASIPSPVLRPGGGGGSSSGSTP
jgi:hypothetical protein